MNTIKTYFYLTFLFSCFFLVACDFSPDLTDGPIVPAPDEYQDGGDSTIGVILCHGRGQSPTWAVVDPLRKGINEQLGYHTLSLQMPKANIPWDEYGALFPDAYEKIETGINRLREQEGVETIYLMGHSMGSRMATAYLAYQSQAQVAGFIGVGIRNGGPTPLDSNANLNLIDLPVLDVFGDGGDGKDAEHAAARADMVSDQYTQKLISGADHLFINHEEQMISIVVEWLSSQPE